MGDGLASILAHRLLEAIVLVAAEGRVDRALGRFGGAPDEGDIGPVQRAGAAMVGELLGKVLVRLLGLGGDHHA
ncbi:hypothetical protein D3C87_1959030 [compost metagenome]